MRKRARWLALFLSVSCKETSPEDLQQAVAPLEQGLVAKVGDQTIRAETVAEVAKAQRIDPTTARDHLIRDALFSTQASLQHLENDLTVRARTRGHLARLLLRDLYTKALQQGDPTDEELARATERHWVELNRPETFRVTHALVKTKEGENREPAIMLASRIAESARAKANAAAATTVAEDELSRLANPDDPAIKLFSDAVKAIDRGSLEVIVEPLPAITEEGRDVQNNTMDADFVHAASRLKARGDVSAPVQTRFGVHVIMLLDRIPSRIASVDERKKQLLHEIVTERAASARKSLLSSLRHETSVERSAEEALSLYQFPQ